MATCFKTGKPGCKKTIKIFSELVQNESKEEKGEENKDGKQEVHRYTEGGIQISLFSLICVYFDG